MATNVDVENALVTSPPHQAFAGSVIRSVSLATSIASCSIAGDEARSRPHARDLAIETVALCIRSRETLFVPGEYADDVIGTRPNSNHPIQRIHPPVGDACESPSVDVNQS